MKEETKQKLKKTIGNASVLASLVITAFSVGACSKSNPDVEKDPDDTQKTVVVEPQTKFNAPTVLISDAGRVTWSTFENATGYKLNINGEELTFSFNEHAYQIPDLEAGKSYTVSVQVLGDDDRYISSDVSAEKSIKYVGTLEATKTLSCLDKTITWDAVEGAVGYKLFIDGIEHKTTETSYTFAPKDGNTYEIKLYAIGDGKDYYAQTTASKTLNYTFALGLLDAPQNLSVTKQGLITWDAVENATEYVLTVDGQEYKIADNSKKLTLVENQKYDISVKAIGDGVSFSAINANETAIDYTHTIPRETLATPVVSIVNQQFVWSAVENAQNYIVLFNGEPYEGEVNVLSSGEMAVDIMSLPLDKTTISVAAKPEGNSLEYKVSEAATCKFDLESHLKTLYEEKYGVSTEFIAFVNEAFVDSSYKDSPVRYGAGLTVIAVNAGNITYRHFEGDTSKISNIPTIFNNQKFSRFPIDEGKISLSYGLEMLEYYTEHTTAGNAYTFGKKILENPDNYDIVCYMNTALSPGHTAPGQYVKYIVKNKETNEVTTFAIAIYICPTAGYAGQIQMKADRGNLRTHGLSWFFTPNKSYFTMESSYYFYEMEGEQIIAGESMFEQEAEAEITSGADSSVALSDGLNEPAPKTITKKLYDVQELLNFALSKLKAEQRELEVSKLQDKQNIIKIDIKEQPPKAL